MAVIFWFRRDLRLEDNHGFYRALRENKDVIPLFIFDEHILSKLEDRDDARVTFIHDEILRLKKGLEQVGSSMIVKHGNPLSVWEQIITQYPIEKVYVNHDYEPYAQERDDQVKQSLAKDGIEFLTFKDQVIFEKSEVLKDDGKPYTVYTPYMKRWKTHFHGMNVERFDPGPYLRNLLQFTPAPIPSLGEMGFTRSSAEFPDRDIEQALISDYDKTRDIPSMEGTSRLGIHLRFGTISIRQLVSAADIWNDVFLNELIWREFYMMILWHFPHVVHGSFKPQYDRIQWRNNEAEFRVWCDGRTGYPIVDAGMRQLNETGYMHNRLRMITASFLTKLLLIDWRWGEAYFARKLLDFELASNNGGWQWSAGTGCDAAPYFRIFNPDSQTQKFDPQLKYTRQWVPELNTEHYPERIVDYRSARERALRVYKESLERRA